MGRCNHRAAAAAAFILIALLSTSSAVAEKELVVMSRLCCTRTGNCPGEGLGQQVVMLNCTDRDGATTTVGRSTTNNRGTFRISVGTTQGLAINSGVKSLLPCVALVRLPVDATRCYDLAAIRGVLQAPVQVIATSPSSVLATTTRFSLLP